MEKTLKKFNQTLRIYSPRNKRTALLQHILLYWQELSDVTGVEQSFSDTVSLKRELLKKIENEFFFSSRKLGIVIVIRNGKIVWKHGPST